jgi:hypothetical protein
VKEYSRFWYKGVFEDQNDVVLIKGSYSSYTAGTNNQLAVAAVTGKQIIVVSAQMTSLGTAGAVGFISASGGTGLDYYTIPANTVSDPNVTLPFDLGGHFETVAGQGLYINTSGASAINIRVRYYER